MPVGYLWRPPEIPGLSVRTIRVYGFDVCALMHKSMTYRTSPAGYHPLYDLVPGGVRTKVLFALEIIEPERVVDGYASLGWAGSYQGAGL
jgi:hypothetical protein